ncbi:ABC transporter permease [Dongia sp.]|uniref:ABC transporter permease n=1 Tax=Dongia sp. TaxID=1977262 RepID=UPI0035B4C4B6
MTALSLARVGAMCQRHFYVLRRSWPRLVEMAYWPTMQMVIWGFLSQFLATNSSYIAGAFGVLISGVMLWDVLFRGQLGFSLSFIEELWSRNLANLYCSPLTPLEHILSLVAMSFVRAVIGVVPAMLLAIPFYDFSIFTLGVPLLAFFFNLLFMGCALGLMVTAMILRYGLAAENMAWFLVFFLAPFSCAYYPVTVLPGWARALALALPSTHVFEGMRAVLFHDTFLWGHFLAAVGLNALLCLVGIALYLFCFSKARKLGLLLQVGE